MAASSQADSALASFMEWFTARNPGEPEFTQAVSEVAEVVVPYIAAHPEKGYAEAKILERLTEPDRVFMFRVPWMDDQGVFQVNRGYRVQINNAIGPYKGGLRFHPTVNLSVLKFLAFEQIFKNSLTTLPLGAGKGGADFDPKGKSDAEVMRFCQSFMTELCKHIGFVTDVPAGDIGVGAREIGYLFGQYKRIRGHFTGVLTGKSLQYGGSLIRPEATGYGNVYFSREAIQHVDRSLEGAVCSVSGSGNVAQYTIEKLNELGAKVVTVSDSSGFVHDPEGIDKARLAFIMALKNERRGRIKEYADEFGASFHEGQKPWGIACDYAYPSATQNEIDEDDARALIENGCKGIFEGANMPCTHAAIGLFQGAELLYAPGKASNAGGVATSGLEMSQNKLGLQWTREEVDQKLTAIMRDIHQKCVEHGSTDGSVDYVKGANIAGFEKVAQAMMSQGLV
ncbi:NADP-specific glutamate dehydrogenase [Acanthopleuribacter pedis]|uniref:Glutamate dehydrogenase n=1 Tax=Acanthopleuribacter pedis TaxID=442870 RepID=A0A8J7QCK3_9BACT|nr:NADP-specific glutamate dehydrogenase [Acanthopleuribacter pedis]MBO1321274.1 NADP-specific glutamate dehydrogenase [Acanthopleuribacter pedis]